MNEQYSEDDLIDKITDEILGSTRGIKRHFEDVVEDEIIIPNANGLIVKRSKNEASDISNCLNNKRLKVGTVINENIACSVTTNETKAHLKDAKTCEFEDKTNNNSEESELSIEFLKSKIDPNQSTNSTNQNSRDSSRKGRVYGLRPRNNRRRSENYDSPEIQKRKPNRRGRGRGKIFTKFRRHTANARERDRMKNMNTAYDALKEALPSFGCRDFSSMTKFSILNLAISYIKKLSNILQDAPQNSSSNITYNSVQTNCNFTQTTDRQKNPESFCTFIEYPTTLDAMPSDTEIDDIFSQYLGQSGLKRHGEVFTDGQNENKIDGRWWTTFETNILQTTINSKTWHD